MNVQRMINAANWMIKIHEAGDKFDLNTWRYSFESSPLYSDQHRCGATCCFGGWLAVSPEFQEAGGSAEKNDGYPILEDLIGFDAIQQYLGTTKFNTYLLANPANSKRAAGYKKKSTDVTALDVAELLLKMIKEYQAKQRS